MKDNLQIADLKNRSLPLDRILLTTEFTKDGYIAQCIVDDKKLRTEAKPAPYTAINHLINVVIQRKKEKGLIRDLDYIFTTKL